MRMKSAPKRSFLLRLCLIVIAVYVAVSLMMLQMEIKEKQAQLGALQESLEAQRLAKKDLERRLSMGEDEKYLARMAREKLEMGYADEQVFKDTAGS